MENNTQMYETLYQIGRQTGITMEKETAILFLEKGLTADGNLIGEYLELLGLKEASEYVGQAAENQMELSEELLRHIHFLLTYHTDYIHGGKYRETVLRLEDTAYCPPKPEEIAHYMGHFMNQLQTSKGIFSPVEYAAICHKRILDISPFERENERTAFMALNFLLLKSNENPVSVPEALQEQYKRAIEAARQGAFPDVGPLTELIERCLSSFV